MATNLGPNPTTKSYVPSMIFFGKEKKIDDLLALFRFFPTMFRQVFPGQVTYDHLMFDYRFVIFVTSRSSLPNVLK